MCWQLPSPLRDESERGGGVEEEEEVEGEKKEEEEAWTQVEEAGELALG